MAATIVRAAALALAAALVAACNTTTAQQDPRPVDEWPSQQAIQSIRGGD